MRLTFLELYFNLLDYLLMRWMNVLLYIDRLIFVYYRKNELRYLLVFAFRFQAK